METLKFNVTINANKEKVWQVLWNDETYRKWTSVFMNGSYVESDWKEGSEIKFLAPDGNGMFSIIEKKTPNQQMIFKHLGEIKKGVKEDKNWKDAREKYFLTEKNNETDLLVELDIEEEYKKYFVDIFPKALQQVKEISENN